MVKIPVRLADIAQDYDALLCDVWGVVHDGRHSFAPAVAALAEFRARGGAVVLLTNAPRPNPPIRAQLGRLGVREEAYDAVVTSGDVTLSEIIARGHAPMHFIGAERDHTLLDAAAEAIGEEPPRVAPDEADYVLCTGLEHDDVETPADYRERLARLAARKLPFLCANPDIVIHRGADLVYCAGALARDYASLGGGPVVYAGKPYPPIYAAARAAAEQALGRTPRRLLAIGDGFATDMAGARDAGIDALFVAGGIHRDETLVGGEPDARKLGDLFAREGFTPLATIAALR